MNSFFKRILILFVCLCTLFFTFSCSSNNQPVKKEESEIKHTGNYLLKDGKTDYNIVVSADCSSNDAVASQEVVALFKEATGVELKVVNDSGLTYNDSATYISVGNTSVFNTANLELKISDLQVNGLAVITKGKSVFLLGGAEYGIFNAAYEFLHQILNFEQFSDDTYSLKTRVKDIELMDYKIQELPDIKRFVANMGFLTANSVAARRMRAGYTPQNIYVWDGGDFTDTSFKILPPATWYETNPEWFADDKSQLCYTAHGDEEKYLAMVDAYVEHLKEIVKLNSTKNIYKFADQDVLTRCTCAACQASYQKYGCASGAKIIFSNLVMDKLNDWFENDEEGKAVYNPNLIFRLNAYNLFEQAPAKYNEATGEYEPIDEQVILHKGLGVEIAPVFADFTKDYTRNKSDYDNMRQWECLFSGEVHIGFWTYCYLVHNFMYPYDSFNPMQELYKVYASFNADSLYDQSIGMNYDSFPCWYMLKTYLQTKLAWNSNSDINELTQRFFDNYFGEASNEMMQLYQSCRAYYVYAQDAFGYCDGRYSIMFTANSTKYWDKGILEGWRNQIGVALQKIEPLKIKNPEKYQKLYKHIVCERASFDFILLDLYSDLLSNYEEVKEDFLNEVKLCNIIKLAEGSGSIQSFIDGLK